VIQTIGVIGGGQLGRMFTLDAKRMGFSIVTLDPQPHSPCGQVADEQIVAPYDDFSAIDELGRRTEIVTYEFENIALASVERLEKQGRQVTPSSHVLRVTQDRMLEKRFLADLRIAVAPFAEVAAERDLQAAGERIGYPAVLKTVRGGYDGKGQWRVGNAVQAQQAVRQAAGAQLIFERWMSLEREISVICTRAATGDTMSYPAAENEHDRGILALSIVPARVEPGIASRAQILTEEIAHALRIVGTFCVEFFLSHEGELLVNEIAPRPHNSGHYTIDAARCSQYEQHVRALCGLPLSPPELLRNAIMVNILGTGTGNYLAGIDDLLADPSIVLHLYGKKHAVERRKMGHFTMLIQGPVTEQHVARARRAHALLRWVAAPSVCA